MFHGEICTYCICGEFGGHPDGRDGRASIGPGSASKWFASTTAKAKINRLLKFARGPEARFAGPPSSVRAATRPAGQWCAGARWSVLAVARPRRAGYVRRITPGVRAARSQPVRRLDFVAAAAAAAAWAGSPPAPGYCWYYTDPSRTQGFWDSARNRARLEFML